MSIELNVPIGRRGFLGRVGSAAAAGMVASTTSADDEQQPKFDLVIIGGTPGGIATAVTAARLGHSVALVEYHRHFGGMSTSGLGKSDIENRAMIQGLFGEFITRIRTYYVEKYGADSENVKLCRDGYYFEPSVAETIYGEMLDENKRRITRMPYHQLLSAEKTAGRVTSVVVRDRATGAERMLKAAVFVDATYEGDLYAAAGAAFRQGRESRDEFEEPHAGHIFVDYRTQQVLPGGSGKGDDRLTTYTYRLCLTTDPANAYRITSPPPNYDRRRYLGYLDDLAGGRFGAGANTTRIALSIAPIPNRKTDVNMNPRGLGFVFVGENAGYVEADWPKREQISQHLRELTLGLLWFLQNDAAIPEEHRRLANEHHLPLDEFTDNGHFPFQLYVREARRLVGEYTLTEHDITRREGQTVARRHDDAIAVGEFPIDSFPVQKHREGEPGVLEGYICMLKSITRPYQIPYRIMVPKEVDGLLVPVAASTTHVAYSSIRLEPTWMALGQAAGVAAHFALRNNVSLRKIPIKEAQTLLRQQGQVLDPT